MIYLDHASATPMKPSVVSAMLPYLSDVFYNPSAPYLPAVEVRQAYESAKSQIAQVLGAKADQLIMTAGATESINLAFAGAERVLISGIEHPAVQAVALAKKSCQILPVTSRGLLDLETVAEFLDDEVDLVSLSLVSSDLGTIQPVAELARLIKEVNLRRRLAGKDKMILLHCDASQALNYLEVNPARLGVDLLTISASKIGGPKQVGALWVRPGVVLKPVLLGGGQEMGLRGGTENVAGVIGFAEACKLLSKGKGREIVKLRDRLEKDLLEIEGLKIIGHSKKRLPNYLVFSIDGLEADRLIYRLEAQGVLLSTGASCSANRGKASLALKSIGLSESEQNASLRLSLGELNALEDIEKAGQIIKNEVKLERERIKHD